MFTKTTEEGFTAGLDKTTLFRPNNAKEICEIRRGLKNKKAVVMSEQKKKIWKAPLH